MLILRLPFENKYMKLENVQNSDFKNYLQIFKLCYHLIRQACKGNTTNGSYMGKYIDFIQNQLDFGLGAEEALLEVCFVKWKSLFVYFDAYTNYVFF